MTEKAIELDIETVKRFIRNNNKEGLVSIFTRKIGIFKRNDVWKKLAHYCITHNYSEYLSFFIDQGLCLKEIDTVSDPIVFYARHEDMLIYLIDNDITLDTLNSNGYKLEYTIVFNNIIFRRLGNLGLNIDINIKNFHRLKIDDINFLLDHNPSIETVKSWIFRHGVAHLIEPIIRKYPYLCSQTCKDGRTVFRYMAHENIKEETVNFLIDNGLDINTPDSYGYTVFTIAPFLVKNNIIKLLYERGADINYRNKNGKNVLCLVYNISTVNMLLDLGVDKYQRDNSGNYPIEYIYNNMDLTTKARFFDTCNEIVQQKILNDALEYNTTDPLRILIRDYNISDYIKTARQHFLLFEHLESNKELYNLYYKK